MDSKIQEAPGLQNQSTAGRANPVRPNREHTSRKSNLKPRNEVLYHKKARGVTPLTTADPASKKSGTQDMVMRGIKLVNFLNGSNLHNTHITRPGLNILHNYNKLCIYISNPLNNHIPSHIPIKKIIYWTIPVSFRNSKLRKTIHRPVKYSPGKRSYLIHRN